MKLLYLITSHTNPEQVIRLVSAIKSSGTNATVVIHHDYSSSNLDPVSLSRFDNTHLVENPIKPKWGRFGLVQMVLTSLRWIEDNNIEYDWIVYISGQDYPITNLSKIERFFEKTEYDGFLAHEKVDAPKNVFWYRYYFRYIWLPFFFRKLLLRIKPLFENNPYICIRPGPIRTTPAIGIRAMKTPFSESFACYKGSNWFNMSRKCVVYIQDFLSSNPEFIKHYRKLYLPDESFFQTILVNKPGLRIANDNLRYIFWSDAHSAHPVSLKENNFEEIIKSGKFFARKFNIKDDSVIFDKLDEYIKS